MRSSKTGHLTIRQGSEEGVCDPGERNDRECQKPPPRPAWAALFHFVAWHEAKFNFKEGPIGSDYARDLAVYDPQVLITGVALKLDEWTALH